MGKEERAKKEVERLGKFNVRVTLALLTNQGVATETINCRTWNHSGNFLGLELYDGSLRVVCLANYHSFTVANLDPDDLVGENAN